MLPLCFSLLYRENQANEIDSSVRSKNVVQRKMWNHQAAKGSISLHG